MSELTDKERIAFLEQQVASLFAALQAWSDTSSKTANAFCMQSKDTLAHIKESSNIFGLVFVMLEIVASKSGISQNDIKIELKKVSEHPSCSNEVSEVISRYLQYTTEATQRNILHPEEEKARNRTPWLLGVFKDGVFVPFN